MVSARKAVAAALCLSLALAPGCAAPPRAPGGGAGREARGMGGGVTDRDVEVAESLGAPEDILAAMRRGEWPTARSKRNVRVAEAAEDHLSGRYGERFRATRVLVSTGFMPEPDTITCAVETGEHAGETCVASVSYAEEPVWADDYLYLRLHGEYERGLEGAARDAFGDLPEGSWVMEARMLDEQYPAATPDAQGGAREVAPDASLEDAGTVVTGHLWICVSPEHQLAEGDFDARAGRVRDALDALDVHVYWEVSQITRPLDGAEFTMEWSRYAEYSWNSTGVFRGDE